MSMKPNVLVLTGFGLNCDHETAYAFELAGAAAKRVHINTLIAGEVSLDDFQILAFGGGFSWGDDHGAGGDPGPAPENEHRRPVARFRCRPKADHRYLQRFPDPG